MLRLFGCLLASNNPNTFDAIATGEPPKRKRKFPWFSKWYTPVYRSTYSPAWMWDRGKSKKIWIEQILKQQMPSGEQNSLQGFRLALDFFDWVFLILATLVLLAAPFVLAFLTSFYTPTVGLSCRSLTFLIYFCSQVWLSLIWLVDFVRGSSVQNAE